MYVTREMYSTEKDAKFSAYEFCGIDPSKIKYIGTYSIEIDV